MQLPVWMSLPGPFFMKLAWPTVLVMQYVSELAEVTWPEGPQPQQMHLDLTVTTAGNLDAQHQRALALGARLLQDRSSDPEEPLRVYADPAGHPFCIFLDRSTPE